MYLHVHTAVAAERGRAEALPRKQLLRREVRHTLMAGICSCLDVASPVAAHNSIFKCYLDDLKPTVVPYSTGQTVTMALAAGGKGTAQARMQM